MNFKYASLIIFVIDCVVGVTCFNMVCVPSSGERHPINDTIYSNSKKKTTTQNNWMAYSILFVQEREDIQYI